MSLYQAHLGRLTSLIPRQHPPSADRASLMVRRGQTYAQSACVPSRHTKLLPYNPATPVASRRAGHRVFERHPGLAGMRPLQIFSG